MGVSMVTPSTGDADREGNKRDCISQGFYFCNKPP